MRIGILGGTFNPVHFGHLRAAEEVREQLGLDQVQFIPAGTPPLKRVELADISHRMEMARLAVADNPGFSVSSLEAERKGPSYTVDTLGELARLNPDAELVFILGADAFLELPKWKRSDEIIRMADFAIVCRPGVPASGLLNARYLEVEPRALDELDRDERTIAEGSLASGGQMGRKAFVLKTTALGISATGIRKRIAEGQSVSYVLPESVKSFIMTNALYTGDVSG